MLKTNEAVAVEIPAGGRNNGCCKALLQALVAGEAKRIPASKPSSDRQTVLAAAQRMGLAIHTRTTKDAVIVWLRESK